MRSSVTTFWTMLLVLAGGSAIAVAESSPAPAQRTLEAIEIEGEIDIPQVLFITSRDHPRYRDGLRDHYRKTALQIGREATWPRPIRSLAIRPEPLK